MQFPEGLENTPLKKMMLVTSDAWLTSHLSHLTRKPVYFIVNCQICVLFQVPCTVNVLTIDSIDAS